MIILDTDSLTIVQGQQGDAYDNLDRRLQHAAAEDIVCVTIISFEEQFRGWMAKIARAKNPDELEQTYRRLRRFFDDSRIELCSISMHQRSRSFKGYGKAKSALAQWT